MSTPGKLLVMAGGTGGHIYPALAVADVMRAKGWQVDWVGTEHGLEGTVVPANAFPLHSLSVRGLRGKGLGFRIAALVRLLVSLLEALRLVRQLQPNVVLGMGGYVAAPAGIAAALLRKPLVIHEQNAVAGTTNRWLAPLACTVLCGLPGAFKPSFRAQVVGNPVRADIATSDPQAPTIPDGFSAERPLRLLVLGGSLGSMPLNLGVPSALSRCSNTQWSLLRVHHQCGIANADAAEQAYAPLVGLNVEISAFIDDMAAAYRWADLVICRAGALTLAELAVTGTPSILVPLPHAIDDHQTRNAETLSCVGAAQLLPQAQMTAEHLGQLIAHYLAFPEQLRQMAVKAREAAQPHATDALVQALEEAAYAT